MTDGTQHATCERRCWQLAGAVAVLLVLLAWAVSDIGFLMSLLVGILCFVGLGLGLIYTQCRAHAVAITPSGKQPAAPVPNAPVPSPPVPAPPRPEPPRASPPKAQPPAATQPEPAESEPVEPASTETATEKPAQTATAAQPLDDDHAEPVVRPTVALRGQAELASRKGSWTYRPDAPPATPAGPARLTAARDGTPDDLKKIKGVGPKLEQLLHTMGFFHFDQIAGWTEAEIAWVDENLEGFKGRVSRDEWVAQAKILAAGGETEFSSRAT